jgi:deoxyribodipyrimidine photo-lyase
VNEDHSAYAQRRDRRVARALGGEIELVACGGIGCVDIASLESGAGRPYSVFTPFHRAWIDAPRRAIERAPRQLSAPGVPRKGRPPPARQLGVDANARRIARAAYPGERAAQQQLDAFLRSGVDRYEDLRDIPAARGTSRLSPALHFGCLSPLAMEARLRKRRSAGARALRRQLAWRDFYLHLIHHHPANARIELRPEMRAMRWRNDERGLLAWKRGLTGYPLVDAGMRQLREQGWIHNRARLVVGSFLVKDLLCDWRRGEAHFMRHLLDGDESSNNGNWQWVSSVGADAQPWFRIFSPTRQQRRFDPGGEYVRRWVPELADMPDRWLAEPWRAPEETQREAGCMIGHDYPAPIVDHASARERALQRFGQRGAGAARK